MFSHLTIMFYLFVALVGISSLSISIMGLIKSKIKDYTFLILFYGLFTIRVFLAFVGEYLKINTSTFNIETIYIIQVISAITSSLFMTSIALYINSIFFVDKRKIMDKIIISVCSVMIILLFIPGSFILDLNTGEFVISPIMQISLMINYSIFLYLLIVIIGGSKKGRTLRELILISALGVFTVIGLIENLSGLILELTGKWIDTTEDLNFLLSSVPYLLFGFVLIYYFTSYLLVNNKGDQEIIKKITAKYNLTNREQELIPLVNSGLNNREIAEKLNISISTVKTHIHNIYDKTGVNGRYELFNLIKSS